MCNIAELTALSGSHMPAPSPEMRDLTASPAMISDGAVDFEIFRKAVLAGGGAAPVSPAALKFASRLEGYSPGLSEPRGLNYSPMTDRSFASDPASSPFGFRFSPVKDAIEKGELDAARLALGFEDFSVTTPENHLKNIIETHAHLSIFKGIDDNLYKLFIDQRRWVDPRGGVYNTKDTFDVREPGYMNAMMLTFTKLFGAPKGSLNIEALNPAFIEQLHDDACCHVFSKSTDEGGHDILEPLKTNYRAPGAEEHESFKLKAAVEHVPGVTSGATISEKGALELVEKFKDPAYNYTITGSLDIFNVFDDVIYNAKEFKKYARDLAKHKSDATQTAPQLPTSIKLRPVPRDFTLGAYVNLFIENFLAAKKDSEDEKLLAVAELIQNLDQLHPFNDGNIRVFAILLLNRLLFDLDLTPACLEDPNCVDCLSLEEIVAEIKKGQAHFLSLKSA